MAHERDGKHSIGKGLTDFAPGPDETGSPPSPVELSNVASTWHAFLLRKATQKVTGMAEAVLSPMGLTLRHFGVLCSVEAAPGQNQRVLGEGLRIDRTTVVGLTDDLERAGLIERRRGVDRRAFSLYLSEAGATQLARLKDMVNDIHVKFLAPLSPAEQAMLRELLLKLTTAPIHCSTQNNRSHQ